jgi:hypothetical protein
MSVGPEKEALVPRAYTWPSTVVEVVNAMADPASKNP